MYSNVKCQMEIIFRTFALLSGALFVSSCQTVESEVTTFSALAPNSFGEPFLIVPSEEQSTSAEFAQYASSIAQRLSSKGWYRVTTRKEARYFVLIDYGVSGSSTSVQSYPIYGQTGSNQSVTVSTAGTSTAVSSVYTMPTWGVVGTQTYSYTYHQRYFQMKIIDSLSDLPVYETKAASDGAEAMFGQVAECIFDMALEDFPFQKITTASVPMAECGS